VRCLGGKRRTARRQIVKHCAKSVHIYATCKLGVVTCGLVWRPVNRCTHQFLRACGGVLRMLQSLVTNIGQMRFAACVEQKVSRLDVAMEDSVLVRMMDGARHLGDYFCRLP